MVYMYTPNIYDETSAIFNIEVILMDEEIQQASQRIA